MKNIKATVSGSILTITVDLSKDFGPSNSGKSIVIASTEGNTDIDGAAKGIKMGLNIYRKN
jgi:hypothetical protein